MFSFEIRRFEGLAHRQQKPERKKRSRPYAFPMHFPTAFGSSQAVSFALECNLRGFFSSGFVLKHPYIHANEYLPESEKGVILKQL